MSWVDILEAVLIPIPFTRPALHSVRAILNQLFKPETNTLTIGTSPTAPSTMMDGRQTVTTAGTRVALSPSNLCQRVTIQALDTNVGLIGVGGSTVVAAIAGRTGVSLGPGDACDFAIDNLSKVYIDSTVSGGAEGVRFTYTN